MTALEEVDRLFVELEAQRREIAWRRSAPDRASDRRAVRGRFSLGVRLDRVAFELEVVSSVPAGPLSAPVNRGAPDSGPPPPAELPAATARLTLIRVHVEELERELDAYAGRGEPDELRWATSEVKNALLLARFRGVPSGLVARDFPELGSARTIERVRRAAGLRPSTGLER
jgi:hypothetical protein